MKRLWLFTTVLLLGFAESLHANTYSPFDVTQVIVTVSPLVGDENAFFSVLGPGTNIAGDSSMSACSSFSQWCSAFATFSPGQRIFPNIGRLFISNFNYVRIGGKNYPPDDFGFTSGLTVNVLGSFTLPLDSHASSFTACVPATVSSPLTGNVGEGPDSHPFSLTVAPGGKFCTTWDLFLGQYQFASGVFSITPVPEPGTLSLIISGLFTFAGRSLAARRRKAQT